MKIINYLFVILFITLLNKNVYVKSYGEGDDDGHPTYSERTSLLMVNMARNNPYKFSQYVMSSFSNYSYSDVNNVYRYTYYAYRPMVPMQYNNDLNRLANGYLDMLIENDFNCDTQSFGLCNGTSFSNYTKKYFTGSSATAYRMAFKNDEDRSVSLGYGAIMASICNRTSSGVCALDNSTDFSNPISYRYMTLYPILTQFGSSSAYYGNYTVSLTFYGQYLYQNTNNTIPSASHIWIYDAPNFYLTFYHPNDYPTKVNVNLNGNDEELAAYYSADSFDTKASPYSTFKLSYPSFSYSECDLYYFTVETYYGNTYRYPDTGYLTLSKESSECDAWVVSSSPKLKYSLFLLFSILIFLLL